jgi:hypothetical protein
MSLIIRQYPDLGPVQFFYNQSERLRFSPKLWLWVRENEDGSLRELQGVTGVIKATSDKSQPLMRWAVRRAMEKLRRLMIEKHLGPDECLQLFESELDKIIAEAKLADSEELIEASETGHETHQYCEALIKSIVAGDRNREMEILAKLPEDIRSAQACCGAVEFFANHVSKFISSERPVYSRVHGFAGTLDILAVLHNCENNQCGNCPTAFENRLSILDLKTSNALWPSFILQASGAYRLGLEEENPDLHVEDVWILRLDKDTGDCESWRIEGEEAAQQDKAGFLHALDLVRSMKTIDNRLGVIRAGRREAKKAATEAAHRVRCPKADDYKGARMMKCFEDGTQCAACRAKYAEKHEKS